MKIILATGGSGGHIYPALQTGVQLKKRGHEVVFAGALTTAKAQIEAAGFSCINIDGMGLQEVSFSSVWRFSRAMYAAFMKSLDVVRREAPDRIVGFGGFGAFPVVLAGIDLGRVCMIHEQNVRPGRANRLLSVFVKKIAITFKDSEQFIKPPKTVWTGCPCHSDPSLRPRAQIFGSFGLRPEYKTIALLGGSQGSQRLNEVFFEAMQRLSQRGIQAVHMTGPKEFEAYAQKYRQANLPVAVSAFIDPIQELYAIADVVVCRAGAATVTELGIFAIPALLVPYPYAGNHQYHNAKVLVNAGGGLLLEQRNLSVELILKGIERCLQGEFSRLRPEAKTQEIFLRNAAVLLAEAVEQL